MTYNFDPDKWYENEFQIIKQKFESGGLSESEFNKLSANLMKRYEEMWDRLDGSYQIWQ